MPGGVQARAWLFLTLGIAVLVAGCGGSSASSPPSVSVPVSTTTPTAASGDFVSTLYGYTVKSPDWSGIVATAAWDGKGSPGSGDPTVDRLVGPNSQQAFGVSTPTTSTLAAFVAKARATSTSARGCPKPAATGDNMIGGEPAIIDEGRCNGVFVLSGYVIHAGKGLVFFTFDQPGNEAAMRVGFRAFLKSIAFTP
jgi:hypothetical protein